MITANYTEVNLATLKNSEVSFRDAHSGDIVSVIVSMFRTDACELTDASGYVHTVPTCTEFKFISSEPTPPLVIPKPFVVPASLTNAGWTIKDEQNDKEPETVAEEVIAAPAVRAAHATGKKSIKSHFNHSAAGQSFKAKIENQYGKPTEVDFKFLGEQVIAWPWHNCSFMQGDIVIDARRK